MTNSKFSDMLEFSTEIDAPVERVWSIVSDLKRMGEWSPQCRKMVVVGGVVREGARTLNLNRQGIRVWPTTAKVVSFVPNERIAFRVVENKTVWSYSLEATDSGTRVTERRETPNGTTAFSQFFIKRFLGGNSGLEADLKRGMESTLARIKTEAERTTA